MKSTARIPARLAPALLCLAGAACAAVASQDGAPPPPAAPFPPDLPPAVVDTRDGSDWIRLNSGEWLKGEIVALEGDTLEFDSEELDTLMIDWADVAEVRTSREFTVLLDDRTEARGVLGLADGRLSLRQGESAREVAREQVFRIIPGDSDEAALWTGRVSLGATVRSGNTDQVDASSAANIKRRTARSRFSADYSGAYGRVEGVENTNNHRLRSQLDRFVHPRVYITPLGIEVLSDPFQNIQLRLTPYAGLGYALIDRASLEWDVQLALGYRWTQFDSVPAGEEDTEQFPSLQPGTGFSADLTERVELELAYQAQIGLQDTNDTNQTASAALIVDLLWELDLDVRLRWDHVGKPQPEADGNVPEKNDLRLTIGVSWEF